MKFLYVGRWHLKLYDPEFSGWGQVTSFNAPNQKVIFNVIDFVLYGVFICCDRNDVIYECVKSKMGTIFDLEMTFLAILYKMSCFCALVGYLILHLCQLKLCKIQIATIFDIKMTFLQFWIEWAFFLCPDRFFSKAFIIVSSKI